MFPVTATLKHTFLPDVPVKVFAHTCDLPLYTRRPSSSIIINTTLTGRELLRDPFILRRTYVTTVKHVVKRCYVITGWHVGIFVKRVSKFRDMLHKYFMTISWKVNFNFFLVIGLFSITHACSKSKEHIRDSAFCIHIIPCVSSQ